MLKGLLVGLGVLIVGAAIYQHKKEEEFDERMNEITRQTCDNITKEMDRMTQETVQNINQFMQQQQMHNM